MPDFRIAAHCADQLGEVPVWCDRTERLWWVDVNRCALRNLDPASGKVSTLITGGGRLGSIALRNNGGLLLATAEGVDFYDPATGEQTEFTARGLMHARQRFNDGRCDRQGRFWVGSMNDDLTPDGVLYRIDTDGKVTPWIEGIAVSNGIATSPDSRTFYFSDTRRHCVLAYDFDAARGSLSNRRVLAQIAGRPGRPDGSCIDAAGFLWSVEYAGGQVTRYAPDGRVDRMIPLPVSHPTAVCFGGPGLRTLFITSATQSLNAEQLAAQPLAGCVLAFEPGVQGLPEPRFAA
ncbi:SMP-30/gluconolactonase/LRE family protein [Variovorax sp. LjRoot178]|uniref:SMP-30/gluconolactonase/LRE family protein n=1 Tax=Variovorax sp. LjRoot178 TaxID=3342277 RepID=UPI003ED102FD